MIRRFLIAELACCVLAGCSTSHPAGRLDRATEYSISCSYFGWYLCYERAKQLCPERYEVLSEKEGPGGRALSIACPDA